jgi:hypothetical protein
MARPYPYPCARTSWFRGLCSLVAALALTSGCRSDEPGVYTTEIDLTTGEYTTMVNIFTTGEPIDTSTGEPVPGDQTCSDAIMCVPMCYFDNPDPGPEDDQSCYYDCLHGMATEEWLALIDFTICVYGECRKQAQCSDNGPNDDDLCRTCVLLGLNNKDSPGCEEQGAACF